MNVVNVRQTDNVRAIIRVIASDRIGVFNLRSFAITLVVARMSYV